MKAILYGAAAAALAGSASGGLLKAPADTDAGFGHQQLISGPSQRARTALDHWFPSEGAPPPYLVQADWSQAEWSGTLEADIERDLANLVDPPPTARAAAAPPPPPYELAQLPSSPEPYLPSAYGDILAPVSYEVDLPEPLPPEWNTAAAYEPQGPAPLYP